MKYLEIQSRQLWEKTEAERPEVETQELNKII